jgi:hypothetical protein
MKLTRYEKELARIVDERYGELPARRLVEELCRMGVVDHTLCKVFAVRRWVDEEMKRGRGKVDAMWMAAEYFCATYEYVRKCMYYYTDVNI